MNSVHPDPVCFAESLEGAIPIFFLSSQDMPHLSERLPPSLSPESYADFTPHLGTIKCLYNAQSHLIAVLFGLGENSAASLAIRHAPPKSSSKWIRFLAPLDRSRKIFHKTLNFFGHSSPSPFPSQSSLPSLRLSASSTKTSSFGQTDFFLPAKLVLLLPKGIYYFANDPPNISLAALSWLLGSYHFDTYHVRQKDYPKLLCPENVSKIDLEHISNSIRFGRDLINMPANHLGPEELENVALSLAEDHKAEAEVVRGEPLAHHFPLLHAAGRGAAADPRLVDIRWGPKKAPKITLVGKGVCFDSGGLNLKNAASMSLMKKDMAGAATALCIGRMVMEAQLNIRLRILLPIIENAIGPSAFRPGDIYRSRAGLQVEITDTDAEGRLILADALTLGCEEKPAYLFDFATLTGSARVALGPEIVPFYTQDDSLAQSLQHYAEAIVDPIWRMPLWSPYEHFLESKIAHLTNSSANSFAGSIVAALFLKRFVKPGIRWAHFDMYGWIPTAGPGRPEGGEVQTARLVYTFLEHIGQELSDVPLLPLSSHGEQTEGR